MKRLTFWLTPLGVLILLAIIAQPWVVVTETTQAVILQWGAPVREIIEPGLHWKLPRPIQTVTRLDKRLLDYDTDPTIIITQDKKTLVVDNYVRYRIVNPTLFLQTVRTIEGAQTRLEDIVYSELRVQLGQFTMTQIITEGRNQIMDAVARASNTKAQEYGIEIVDVRIKRTDLPLENEQAVFARMRAERERQAREYRAQGEEQAQAIRAQADRMAEVILAEAYRQAQLLRGEGDAEASRIYAQALSEDPEFYAFTRSLDAYRATLREGSTFVLDASSEFLRYLGGPSQ